MFNESAGELIHRDGRDFIRTRPEMSGIAIYGPYETLEPGSYKVEFLIVPLGEPVDERDPLCAVVDIIAESGVKLIDSFAFRSDIVESRLIIFFRTDRRLHGVEYRLYVNGVEPLLLGETPFAAPVSSSESSSQRRRVSRRWEERPEIVRDLFFAGIGLAARGEELVVTIGSSLFSLNTPEDFGMVEELILKHTFSIKYPAPVSFTSDEEMGNFSGSLLVGFGAETSYGKIAFLILKHVMDGIYGSHRHLHCSTLSQLHQHWSGPKGKPVLITTDGPDIGLSLLLTTSHIPIIGFFDDPRDAVIESMTFDGFTVDDAIRICTKRFCCLAAFAGSDDVHIFDPPNRRGSLLELVESICVAVTAETNASLAARVVERLGAEYGVSTDDTVAQSVRRLRAGDGPRRHFTAAEESLIEWFAHNYGPVQFGLDQTIEWPRRLFSVGLNGETGETTVDLIGSARYIFWGPYLHLPFGTWRASIQFEVAENFSGNEIEADIWLPDSQTEIARRMTKLPVQGHFQFTLDFLNAEPQQRLEIRIRLLKGAIEGQMTLRRVTLEPVAGFGDILMGAARRRGQASDGSLGYSGPA
jgi:hypothetical protein